MKKIKKVTAKTLQKRNAKFAKMSPAEKRIAIAKDVILSEKQGQNVHFGGYYHFGHLEYDRGSDMQTVLNKGLAEGVKCDVCAMGALMVSKIKIGDGCSGADVMGGCQDASIINQMDGIFSGVELRIIEDAYEGDNDYVNIHEWRYKYSDDSTRMIAIMQNIIDNKGTFKP